MRQGDTLSEPRIERIQVGTIPSGFESIGFDYQESAHGSKLWQTAFATTEQIVYLDNVPVTIVHLKRRADHFND